MSSHEYFKINHFMNKQHEFSYKIITNINDIQNKIEPRIIRIKNIQNMLLLASDSLILFFLDCKEKSSKATNKNVTKKAYKYILFIYISGCFHCHKWKAFKSDLMSGGCST